MTDISTEPHPTEDHVTIIRHNGVEIGHVKPLTHNITDARGQQTPVTRFELYPPNGTPGASTNTYHKSLDNVVHHFNQKIIIDTLKKMNKNG